MAVVDSPEILTVENSQLQRRDNSNLSFGEIETRQGHWNLSLGKTAYEPPIMLHGNLGGNAASEL